nr:hypothetical protein [Pseudo-nitzschia hainanensis]UBA15763.1 hypothetical protein [Pseudo-nitzschia hainanensis]
MKIFKYLIFLSILSGIFFLIYRQSDQKGLLKFWLSLKIAVPVAAIAAGLILLNTKTIESPGNNNPVYQERLLSDTKVILVKAGDSSPSIPTSHGTGQPSNFPIPPTGGRPSRPVHVPKYHTAPKVVPSPGLGAGANPAGAGGGGGAAEFGDDKCPAPNKEQSQESKTYNYRSNNPKKKKQSIEQYELDKNVNGLKVEIVYRIKENSALVREAERVGNDQAAQKDINNLIEQLSLGNDNPGIGNRRLKDLKNVLEARGRNQRHVYFREKDGKIEILAKSNKDNQKKVIAILQKMGY